MMKKNSIASKLFLLIFTVYIIVTLVITALQLVYSYAKEKKYVMQEISSVTRSFEVPLGEAIWGYETDRINTITRGMIKTPLISAVKIYDEHGGLIESNELKNEKYDIKYEQSIFFEDFNEKRYVGKIAVFGNSEVIIKRVLKELTVLLVAALVKTAALFLLFFWVFRKFLLIHLENFTRQIKELNADKLEDQEIKLGINENNELKTLEMSFNQLIRRLVHSKTEMKNINTNLDKLVKERTRQLEILSTTDELTGLYNRRYFKDAAERELNRCRRDKKTFTFAVLDIDDFKKYNDYYGHVKGDEALKAVSNAIRTSLNRGNDFVFRMGGEEFCVITSGLDEDSALALMENIRFNVQNLGIEHKQSRISAVVTVSIGILHISGDKGCDIDVLYRGADHALYQAKDNGRNRTEMLYCKGHNDENAVCKTLFKEQD